MSDEICTCLERIGDNPPCPVHDIKLIHWVLVGVAVAALIAVTILTWKVGMFQF